MGFSWGLVDVVVVLSSIVGEFLANVGEESVFVVESRSVVSSSLVLLLFCVMASFSVMTIVVVNTAAVQ